MATTVWHSIAVFLVSMLPLVENKGAIVLAKVFGMPHLLSGILCALGSYIPVPLLLYTNRLNRFGQEQKRKGIPETFRKYIERYGSLALLVLIAIPFTGMGCWLGAALARIMKLNKLKAAVCIFIGNAIAVAILTGAVHGIVVAIEALLGL